MEPFVLHFAGHLLLQLLKLLSLCIRQNVLNILPLYHVQQHVLELQHLCVLVHWVVGRARRLRLVTLVAHPKLHA